jgi:hypothetical protein
MLMSAAFDVEQVVVPETFGGYSSWILPTPHIPESDGMIAYSFALYPDQYQPSGCMSMSRVSSTELRFTVAFPREYLDMLMVSAEAGNKHAMKSIAEMYATHFEHLSREERMAAIHQWLLLAADGDSDIAYRLGQDVPAIRSFR